MPANTAGDRVARLLNLVPYLLARPGIGIAQAATELDITERQLREDLELLWVCGLPGYGPGDLIDMAFDGDNVTITYDAGIDRPLRLTPDEALALVVALRMLAEMPGIDGRSAIERALANAPALVDVVTSQTVVSSDATKGLGFVPEFQALTAWDDLERKRRGLADLQFWAS